MTQTTVQDLGIRLSAKRQAEATFLREFIVQHGTLSQKQRFDAGLLPGAEAMEAMADVAFEPVSHFEPFFRITVDEVVKATALAGLPTKADGAMFRSLNVKELDAERWGVIKVIGQRLPGATVTAKLHEATLDRDDVPWGIVKRLGALVVMPYGPFELRREFTL